MRLLGGVASDECVAHCGLDGENVGRCQYGRFMAKVPTVNHC